MTATDRRRGWPASRWPRIHRRWFHPGGPELAPDGAKLASGAGGPIPLVLLHEGLGSISTWGAFPPALADTTGRSVLAYDRAGYGRSEPRPGPWPAEFMHYEAVDLARLLRAEGVERAVLVGHSDGASISLLYPSQAGPGAPEIAGIVSLSAHVMVEEMNVASIVELRRTYAEALAPRLARHHDDADTIFELWSEVWVSDRFRAWSIDDELGAVTCPVLAIQGGADSYGTGLQLDRLAAAVGGPVEVVELPGVDHWPHKRSPSEVLRLITEHADEVAPPAQ